MTNCNLPFLEFPRVKRRKIHLDFSGGHISSDGGAVLLRQADSLAGLCKRVTIDGAKHSWAILSLLIKRLRQAWAEVRIIFRGDMENRIKEQQLDLFADRTSAHKWWANQFCLLLASLAYILLEPIRRGGLKGTELARAQAGSIRLKLLKIGCVIIKNIRRIRLMLPSAYPCQSLFRLVVTKLNAG